MLPAGGRPPAGAVGGVWGLLARRRLLLVGDARRLRCGRSVDGADEAQHNACKTSALLAATFTAAASGETGCVCEPGAPLTQQTGALPPPLPRDCLRVAARRARGQKPSPGSPCCARPRSTDPGLLNLCLMMGSAAGFSGPRLLRVAARCSPVQGEQKAPLAKKVTPASCSDAAIWPRRLT